MFSGLAVVLGVAAFGVSMPGLAQPGSLAMLDALAKGEWTVRFRDGTASRKICLQDGRELIQLQHSENNCSRFVVEDGQAQVTVQYTCAGNGYGRTSIRRENNSLAQIESQGIADGLPFQFTAEARRTGVCN
ncbi:DUF3617 domain-containing protein [Altererythrobacter sp.]|uniref:DUF3617 domain-containing protein n=1 Tax=Altererythrobacter sp. TaxID=1872480 RepID=UPI003D04F790